MNKAGRKSSEFESGCNSRRSAEKQEEVGDGKAQVYPRLAPLRASHPSI